MDLTPDNRYSRHTSLPQIGEAGQARIRASHVLIVGLGGLGSPASLYLAAAGVGRLTLADFDTVEVSNLQRQVAHTTDRVGQLKTTSARQACLDINPDCRIETLDYALDEDDLDSLVAQCTAVLDCTDNFPTRFALNAACVRARVPLVSGAAIRFDGQISVYDSRQSDAPCYRCLYSDSDNAVDNCAQAGILGPVVGMVGCIQAIEALKLISDIGDSLAGRLVLFDGLTMEWNEIRLGKNPECPVCGSDAAA
ncbi:HesA/MoeB/ThiF family protein [Granulosicoccus sp. 3-233]|uniref:HesA/MoeB/ThiF family protein n=1 Tax=Granulosicoccus sp. 3-233 TaxID=3417969 RepID=UPI003D34FF12